MAEENKSSKGIGELYIEFGSKGLPNFLKNLNAISAQFLLTKNAAGQFLKPIIQTAKEAGNAGVQIGKMSASFGASYEEFQKLKIQLQRMNIDDGVINNISDLQSTLYDLFHGFGGLPPGLNLALDRLGIDIMNYDESLDGTLRLIKDMEKASKNLGMSDLDYQSVLRQAGLPAELVYARNRGGLSDITEFRTISDKEVEALIKTQESMSKLQASIDTLKNTIIARFASPIITTGNEGTDRLLNNNTSKAEKVAATGDIALSTAIGAILGSFVSPVAGTLAGAAIGARAGTWIGGLNIEAPQKIKNSLNSKDGQLTGGAAAIQELKNLGNDLMPQQIDKRPSYDFIRNETKKNGVMDERPWEPDPIQAAMPSNMSNLIQNIYINNDIDIQSNNAQETANRIAEIDRQDIEYSQFQMSNLAGL